MKGKKYIFIFFICKIIFISLLSILLFPSEIYASTNPKYFGYYWGMEGFTNVSTYVNTMFVSNQWNASDIPTLASLDIANLNTLNQYKSKGIVDVSSVFFNISDRTLRPDWQSRWDSYWTLINPHLSKIRAFYPMDEPGDDMMNNYQQVVQAIKLKADTVNPKIPILMVITSSAVLRVRDNLLTIPAGVSWLGFDEYGCWGNECFGGVSITGKLNILINAMSGRGGNVIVIPDGVKIGTVPPTSEEQTTIWVPRAQAYYDLCKSKPQCIGMFTFLWNNVPHLNLIGVVSMPILEQKFEEIGTDIKNNLCPKFISGNCSKTTLNPGEAFVMGCDFGSTTLNCIATTPNGTFKGWSGTTALFDTVAQSEPGNYSAYCRMFTTEICPSDCNASYDACKYLVISPTPPPSTPKPSPTPIPGDANRDGKVDVYDIAFVTENWNKKVTPALDQFADGKINALDTAKIIGLISLTY